MFLFCAFCILAIFSLFTPFLLLLFFLFTVVLHFLNFFFEKKKNFLFSPFFALFDHFSHVSTFVSQKKEKVSERFTELSFRCSLFSGTFHTFQF